jgi:MoaA/NifB/PqqE/SkfB family radical SAM enzyme
MISLNKYRKYAAFARSYIKGSIRDTAGFVRIIPTDRCNLKCQYCWQRRDDSYEMKWNEFLDYLEKAEQLGVGLITFLGGEPMLWGRIYDAIAACTERHILTDMTTNGTLLNRETILKLSKSGLDYLNISTDGLKISSISKKNKLVRNDLIGDLASAKKKYGMHTRLNAVIYNDNFDEIKSLMEFSKNNDIQLSIGYVIPPINVGEPADSEIYFSLDDRERLQEIIADIVSKKRAGYPIIDPEAYFKNIFLFMHREVFWNCNYPTRYGWINIAPNGKIRSCTKKMDELDIAFLDLNSADIKALRSKMKRNLANCNVDCYSNCAYDSAYYVKNKLQMVAKIFKRFRMPNINSRSH